MARSRSPDPVARQPGAFSPPTLPTDSVRAVSKATPLSVNPPGCFSCRAVRLTIQPCRWDGPPTAPWPARGCPERSRGIAPKSQRGASRQAFLDQLDWFWRTRVGFRAVLSGLGAASGAPVLWVVQCLVGASTVLRVFLCTAGCIYGLISPLTSTQTGPEAPKSFSNPFHADLLVGCGGVASLRLAKLQH